MGDDDSINSLDALYYHRQYLNPVYGKWHQWFAWYPVMTFTWIKSPFSTSPFKATNWAWLRTVSRRKVQSGSAVAGFMSTSHEYVETFDILKFSGVPLSQV